ncbi:MAG: glycosyltransferase [Cyclobacteriaceae bacterium]
MKILITVDPEIPVPPIAYGGIERIVDQLIYAYSREGHEVTLVANPKSSNSAAVQIIGWDRLHSRGYDNVFFNAKKLYRVVREVQPDIIHSFSRLLYQYPVFFRTSIPVYQTYQRQISRKSTSLAASIAGNQLAFTCCGAHMIKEHPIADKCTPIHNFTNIDYFKPAEKASKHLFYLGRIEDLKGTREAIDVALATGKKLIIAGNIEEDHVHYFEKQVEPHLKNSLIEFVGPVNDSQKLEYLQQAEAFLFPIKWEEPFGIVMVEAMACGVPVIGFDRGAVPEVVVDGVTGFVVKDVDEMIRAVKQVGKIDRKAVRDYCVKNFSTRQIASQYLDLFNATLKAHAELQEQQ